MQSQFLSESFNELDRNSLLIQPIWVAAVNVMESLKRYYSCALNARITNYAASALFLESILSITQSSAVLMMIPMYLVNFNVIHHLFFTKKNLFISKNSCNTEEESFSSNLRTLFEKLKAKFKEQGAEIRRLKKELTEAKKNQRELFTML